MEEEKKDTGSSAGEIKEEVRKHYGGAITGKKGTCCCSPGPQERIISLAELAGYDDKERSQVPGEAYNSSFGCGNPMMFTDVKPGDVVHESRGCVRGGNTELDDEGGHVPQRRVEQFAPGRRRAPRFRARPAAPC